MGFSGPKALSKSQMQRPSLFIHVLFNHVLLNLDIDFPDKKPSANQPANHHVAKGKKERSCFSVGKGLKNGLVDPFLGVLLTHWNSIEQHHQSFGEHISKKGVCAKGEQEIAAFSPVFDINDPNTEGKKDHR